MISVRGAGTMNPVNQKPGNVGDVTLDGPEPGLQEFLRGKKNGNKEIENRLLTRNPNCKNCITLVCLYFCVSHLKSKFNYLWL